ncbi:M20 metallopeptidase family protein [Brevibacterium linens]|uniref:Amidohydrolase n=1 Tax=Brevibacterium linens TaxID=1703 RepID=A0A0B9ATP3_BRELN|nr:amidohydrolase [Brevibacterium linens]
MNNFISGAQELAGDMAQLRHRLHRHPELGLELPRTQEAVLNEISDLPLEITLGDGLNSIGAVLRGGAATSEHAPAVLLRADMDALPLQEATGVDYSSTVDGRMHACGHDLHTSMLTGAARLLAEQRHRLGGDVVFMFQPAEELLAGAPKMIEEGILDLSGRRVDSAFGLHVFSAGGSRGAFSSMPGVMMSAADALFVQIKGRGGHGSQPQHAADPIPAMAAMVTALQTMVTRQFDAHDPVIVSVGRAHSGEAINVIPDEAEFGASLRTYSAASREKLQRLIPSVLEGVAMTHGVDVEIEYRVGGRVLANDNEHTEFAAREIAELFGGERYTSLTQPLGGSEDFADVLAEVPGTFVKLDASAGEDAVETNHSPRAIFDDRVLPDGAALYAQLAASRLTELAA